MTNETKKNIQMFWPLTKNWSTLETTTGWKKVPTNSGEGNTSPPLSPNLLWGNTTWRYFMTSPLHHIPCRQCGNTAKEILFTFYASSYLIFTTMMLMADADNTQKNFLKYSSELCRVSLTSNGHVHPSQPAHQHVSNEIELKSLSNNWGLAQWPSFFTLYSTTWFWLTPFVTTALTNELINN